MLKKLYSGFLYRWYERKINKYKPDDNSGELTKTIIRHLIAQQNSRVDGAILTPSNFALLNIYFKIFSQIGFGKFDKYSKTFKLETGNRIRLFEAGSSVSMLSCNFNIIGIDSIQLLPNVLIDRAKTRLYGANAKLFYISNQCGVREIVL